MTATASRKELHTMIDTMPDHFVQAMMPLVTCMTEEYWKPVIEPASPEAAKKAAKLFKEYEKDPSSFVPFKKRVTG